MSWRLCTLALLMLPGCSDKNDTGSGGDDSDTALGPGGPGGGTTGGTTGGEPGDGETGAQIGMTSAHNVVRAEEDVAPLRWSTALARDAQDWADQLSATSCSFLSGATEAGDSLFVGYPAGSFTNQDVVDEWAAEGSYYSYTDNVCTPPHDELTCVHYLQIVWAETQRLGCGMAVCEDGWEVWACIYDPPGNTGGQPY